MHAVGNPNHLGDKGPSSASARFPGEPAEATHRTVVLAQLLLAPEAQVQPVARHVQVLGAEAGAAVEAPRGPRRRHGETPRGPAGFRRSTSGYAPNPGGALQRPRGRSKFSRAEKNEDSPLPKTVRGWSGGKRSRAEAEPTASAESTRPPRYTSEVPHHEARTNDPTFTDR